MAFDQNLEADRIDGFNLFSAFVRVPLLVLGGILGSDESSSSNDINSDSLSNHGRCIEDGVENGISTETKSDGQFRVIGTDCTNRLKQRRHMSNTLTMAHSSFKKSSESVIDPCYHNSGIERTKKMSWSDESGLPLAYENDEVRRKMNSVDGLYTLSIQLCCIQWYAIVCRLVDSISWRE